MLPACTFAESPDVNADEAEVSKQSLVPPQGNSKPDFDILTALAEACGLGRYFPWKNFAEAMAAPRLPWMLDAEQQPWPRPGARADFGTPTGRAEFVSTQLEEAGHEGLPVWAPPEAPTEEFPLRLVTGPRPRAGINSQFATSPAVRARMRENELLVHPDAAQRCRLTHGGRATVTTPAGRIAIRVVVTEDVHPEAVVMAAGWADANPNRLVDGSKFDPISGFPAFRSAICRVEPGED